MKRFHIHISVEDLDKSVQFYSTLFGEKPVKLKKDYAKWLLDDPRLNFAISARGNETGVNHLGIQVEENAELEEVTQRLKKSNLEIYDEGVTECCYAKSNKAWVLDPAGVPWEAYQNMSDIELFGDEKKNNESSKEPRDCCVPDSNSSPCCG